MLFSPSTIYQFIILVVLFYLLSPGIWEKITKDPQEQTAIIHGIIFAVLFLVIARYLTGEN